MVNNAIDHSEGTYLVVAIDRSDPHVVELSIMDDGIGIFRKLRLAFDLESDQDAILELAKGKLTTDPARHTGEGIYFTSRMFDAFAIVSKDTSFIHVERQRDRATDRAFGEETVDGTFVVMQVSPTTSRTTTEVFDRFATPDSYEFDVTRVPVILLGAEEGGLVSRSQAKRLVRRFEDFKEVILDFAGVPTVGQAFADEIFRVWQANHPDVRLLVTNVSPDAMKMIKRAQARYKAQSAESKSDTRTGGSEKD